MLVLSVLRTAKCAKTPQLALIVITNISPIKTEYAIFAHQTAMDAKISLENANHAIPGMVLMSMVFVQFVQQIALTATKTVFASNVCSSII